MFEKVFVITGRPGLPSLLNGSTPLGKLGSISNTLAVTSESTSVRTPCTARRWRRRGDLFRPSLRSTLSIGAWCQQCSSLKRT